MHGLVLTCWFAAVATASGTSDTARLAGEITVPLPDGWTAEQSTGDYPFRLFRTEGGAELLIYRSDLDTEETIDTDEQLKGAVDEVIDDVILHLPGAQVLANTGFYQGERCGFVIDFLSTDSAAGVTIRNRFAGLVYRHEDGGQVLFTLWGRAGEQNWDQVAPAIMTMQEGFRYEAPHTADVFTAATSRGRWQMMSLALLLVAILVLLRMRRGSLVGRRNRPRLWRCDCGTWNSPDDHQCRRCDRPREAVPTT